MMQGCIATHVHYLDIGDKFLDAQGKPGTLIAISDSGYYEIVLEVQARNHTVLFPIAETVIIFNEALPTVAPDFEVER